MVGGTQVGENEASQSSNTSPLASNKLYYVSSKTLESLIEGLPYLFPAQSAHH